jgi:drug/metabolite transporter (DMT)-like permease
MLSCGANVSIFINLVPVDAIFIWLLLLAEPISLSLILGGSLVLTGVFFTNRS